MIATVGLVFNIIFTSLFVDEKLLLLFGKIYFDIFGKFIIIGICKMLLFSNRAKMHVEFTSSAHFSSYHYFTASMLQPISEQ